MSISTPMTMSGINDPRVPVTNNMMKRRSSVAFAAMANSTHRPELHRMNTMSITTASSSSSIQAQQQQRHLMRMSTFHGSPRGPAPHTNVPEAIAEEPSGADGDQSVSVFPLLNSYSPLVSFSSSSSSITQPLAGDSARSTSSIIRNSDIKKELRNEGVQRPWATQGT